MPIFKLNVLNLWIIQSKFINLQLAWGSSTAVGCGFSECSKREFLAAFLVCHYHEKYLLDLFNILYNSTISQLLPFELYQHSHFFEAEKLKLRLFRGNVIDAPIYQVGKPCKKDEECTLFKGSKCSKHEGLCYVSEKKPKRLALKILAQ